MTHALPQFDVPAAWRNHPVHLRAVVGVADHPVPGVERSPEVTDKDPTPPTNVRLVRADGTTLPLECRYDGQDADGQHVWTALLPHPITVNPSDQFEVDKLPARTRIQVSGEPRQ